MSSQVLEVMPCIADKFVIEIANSIQVSQDHVRVQSERLGKVARLVDGFTGAGQQRQQQINQNMTTGLNAAFDWLNTLTRELSLGFTAIQVANQKITEVQNAVTDLAEFSIETRDLLEQLSINLHDRCDGLDERLTQVEAETGAERQITLLFKQWETGGFAQISPLLRLYTVLERLYWGEFGSYYRQYNTNFKAEKTIQNLKERICLEAIQCLKKDKQIDHEEFFHPLQWAENVKVLDTGFMESYAYMGDWAHVDKMPIHYFASQQPKKLSLYLPRVLTADVLARSSLDEMFGVRS